MHTSESDVKLHLFNATMLSRLEELSLIAKCIATDNRDAFGRLVIEYEEDLRRFLLNLTQNDACLTDDIAQETFLKAYLAIKSFRGIAKFRTWLYRIAYNEFISYKRKYSNNTVDIQENYPDISSEPHNSSDVKIDIATCISTLNDTERTIVLLFYMEDLPIKKISQITGFPNGTIKSYLNRARAKMQSELNK